MSHRVISGKEILDRDLTKFPAIIYLALVFFISRIPFLNLGFSAFTSPTDQDVLAVVNSAYLLRYEHVYTVSRFPGYPFFEIFNSLLIGGGWVLTNVATSIMSFISLIIFGKILKQFEIKNKSLLLLTFAFIPVIWINSTITMDYMWALMFILLACHLVFAEKYNLAGISLGLAIGSRFTSLFMIIPIFYWMYVKKAKSVNIREFLAVGFFTSVVMFLPVIYKYNLKFLQGSGFLHTTPLRKSFEAIENSILLSSINLITELTGLLAFIMIVVLVVFFKKSLSIPRQKHVLNFCWIVLILYVIIYFIFPYKVAYLIPVIPWGLLILNEKLNKHYLVIICILLILNNILSINMVNEDSYKPKLDSGIILKNYDERKQTGINQSENYLESLSEMLNEEKNT